MAAAASSRSPMGASRERRDGRQRRRPAEDSVLDDADRGQHRESVIRDWFAFDAKEIESVGRWVRHSNQHPFLTFYGPLIAAALTFTVSGFVHPMLALLITLPAYYVASRVGERIVRWRV